MKTTGCLNWNKTDLRYFFGDALKLNSLPCFVRRIFLVWRWGRGRSWPTRVWRRRLGGRFTTATSFVIMVRWSVLARAWTWAWVFYGQLKSRAFRLSPVFASAATTRTTASWTWFWGWRWAFFKTLNWFDL